MFSEQYKNAFSTPCQFPLNYGKPQEHHLHDMIFNELDIIRAIDELSLLHQDQIDSLQYFSKNVKLFSQYLFTLSGDIHLTTAKYHPY